MKITFWTGIIGIMLLAGCQREHPDTSAKGEVYFTATSSRNGIAVMASSDNPVDRILVLPFRKIDNGLSDEDGTNFAPDYEQAVQWDIASFPTGNRFLDLEESSRYKVLVIGYKSTDYDFNNPSASTATFSLGADASPENLENFQVRMNDPENTPELFMGRCQVSIGGTPQGELFTVTPGQAVQLNANLSHFVSGLSIEISDIPDYVDSVTLSAGKITRAIRLNDSIPSVMDDSASVGSTVKLLQTAPSAGSLSITKFLLPATDTDFTLLYLDIKYGTNTERYMVKVNDSEVSNNNGILFLPNKQVHITGSYNSINIGFTLNNGINLDDDTWDGVN